MTLLHAVLRPARNLERPPQKKKKKKARSQNVRIRLDGAIQIKRKIKIGSSDSVLYVNQLYPYAAACCRKDEEKVDRIVAYLQSELGSGLRG